MVDERWSYVWELFHQAIETPADERQDFLKQVCGDDDELHREISALVAAHDSSSEFMMEPCFVAADIDSTDSDQLIVGEEINGYRILRLIAEGGMGAVYEAAQVDPVRRRVALKVIKIGMDTREVISRFEIERQAVALMTHPNIAQVYDGGATGDGRPYFVMEYVPGIPITEYCDKYRLGTRDRLNLMLKVCSAVQHAHQKGIIHRDIKPSNILVSIEGDTPTPKVIDFGVAKATEQKLTEHTVYTQLGRFIGTPAYTSPEQANLTNLDIDTRTDIYSLGVLLYELLAGRLPFETNALVKDGYAGMQRVIQEDEPPKPSTKVSHLSADEAIEVGRSRRCSVSEVIRELRGDLDWIAMKAMEKDRTRRYDSSSEFAADIKRYLANQPVVAGPPSTAYRVKKFVGRHRVGFALSSAMVTVLVIATFVASAGWLQATEAEERATLAASKAETVNEFLLDMLAAAAPSIARGRDTTVLREMVDNAARRIAQDGADLPNVEAAIRKAIGDTYLSLGSPDLAEPHLVTALSLLEADGSADDFDIARTLHSNGELLQAKGHYEESEAQFRRAIEIYERLESMGNNVDSALADAMVKLSWLLIGKRNFEEAEQLGANALAIRTAGLDTEDRNIPQLEKIVAAHNNLGMLYRYKEEYDASQAHYEEALEFSRQIGDQHPVVATTLNNFGLMLVHRREYEKGELLLFESLELRREILTENHPEIAESMNNLAMALVKQRRYPEAENYYKQSLAIVMAVQGIRHPHVATLNFNLAEIMVDQGKFDEAAQLYKDALSIDRDQFPDEHPYVTRGMVHVGKALTGAGSLTDALTWFENAIRLTESSVDEKDWRLAEARAEYAVALMQLNRLSEAEALLLSAYSALKESDPEDLHRLQKPTVEKLTRLYEISNQPEKIQALDPQSP
jgi:serine/threonine protein kinase/tetratricopeptide (TPR) repeat protein